MSRRSKIASLRKEIRDDLNQKLEEGEPGNQIVDWLNSQPEVQSVLRCQFQGNPITEQNLSDWRNGGFLDWQRAQESWAWMQQLGDEADELKERGFGAKISNWFGILMSAEMTSTARELIQAEPDPAKRWERLCDVYKQVSRLRRDDLASTHMRLRQEKWIQEIQESLRHGQRTHFDLADEDSTEVGKRRADEIAMRDRPEPPRRHKARKKQRKTNPTEQDSNADAKAPEEPPATEGK